MTTLTPPASAASAPADLLARIDRLESLDAIRQLAGKYSLSLDMRDLDAHRTCSRPTSASAAKKPGAPT
ncbi:hypothetical protein [Thauera sp. SDU_THAU2]|uniref:hypothetical protein n=1 Tax=Thauera sp. SDU_THAU2 TaxID=3136633 RepID=UPI00311EB11A